MIRFISLFIFLNHNNIVGHGRYQPLLKSQKVNFSDLNFLFAVIFAVTEDAFQQLKYSIHFFLMPCFISQLLDHVNSSLRC